MPGGVSGWRFCSRRQVPGQVGVLVIDWFHWRVMGDWSFDPAFWPDPKAMVAECKSYGIEVMVASVTRSLEQPEKE